MIYNQWNKWTCSNYALMAILNHKWIKFDEEKLSKKNWFTYPALQQLFRDNWVNVQLISLPSVRLVDLWLKRWEYILVWTNLWDFTLSDNLPNTVELDWDSNHFFVIVKDLWDKWLIQNSWWEWWWMKGTAYLYKDKFSKLFTPKRVVITK